MQPLHGTATQGLLDRELSNSTETYVYTCLALRARTIDVLHVNTYDICLTYTALLQSD
jgi:hypothetical protein